MIELKRQSYKSDEARELLKIKKPKGDSREISGYASVFGVIDSHMDVTERGTFAQTIKEDIHRCKFFDDHYGVIGKITELVEDEIGLFYRAFISKTQRGNDVLQMIKDEVLTESSIGYRTKEKVDGETYNGVPGVTILKRVQLWEVSAVVWGSNPKATATAQKNINLSDLSDDEVFELYERIELIKKKSTNEQKQLLNFERLIKAAGQL